jgi:hypothetical protein
MLQLGAALKFAINESEKEGGEVIVKKNAFGYDLYLYNSSFMQCKYFNNDHHIITNKFLNNFWFTII